MPQPLTDHRNIVLSLLILFGDKHAANQWLNSEPREKQRRSKCATDAFLLSRAGWIKRPVGISDGVLKNLALVTPIHEIRKRSGYVATSQLCAHSPELYELVGFF